MRVLLFTGKGGVGKTSVAAATALRAAGAGLRTLVASTDPAHSLGDALGVPLGPDPVAVAERCEAQQIDAHARLTEHWSEVQRYLAALLAWGGVGEVQAEELSVLPGLEEVLGLIDLKRHVEAGRHDLLVVDCAPTAETLRLLSLPDVLAWYLERVFPIERRLAKVVRPVVGRMTSMPLPGDGVHGAVERMYEGLATVRGILQDGRRTTVRLVVNPERVVVAEARRTYTHLSLFGYHVDAVVVNRVLPEAAGDGYFSRWRELQAEHLVAIEAGFAGLPVLTAPWFDDELVGPAALARLGDAVYGDRAVAEVLHESEPLRVTSDTGGYALSVALPFADRADVDAYRRGDELYVQVAGRTRTLVLPAVLRRCEVTGAALDGGRLEIRFSEPGPSPRAPHDRSR